MRLRVLVAVATIVIGIPSAVATTASSAEGVAGSAGTDTYLPATDSALTLPGRGAFGDLRVTVNQTKGLSNQAVSVTWAGGRPSTGFSANWIQMFQCWGEDDGTNPDNPGPPPEQCQFGAEPFAGSVLSKIPAGANPSNSYSRVVANEGWSTFDTEEGDHDPATGRKWKPTRAVDGSVVARQLTLTGDPSDPNVTTAWQNPLFDYNKTNEADWERTYGEGKGTTLFQLFTGLESTFLGCGQQVQRLDDGTQKAPRCWLVVVPRGTPEEENPSNVPQPYVAVSPLASTAWKNRIAFPLEFNPVDSPCAIGGDQRRIAGGELAARAVFNWQPTLCGAAGGRPYAFQVNGDEQARRQVLAGEEGSAGMAIVSRPIDPAKVDAENPVTYAPVSLSGAVIGFNVERKPVDYDGNVRDPAEEPLAGLRVTNLNLTPRLVAKLLTQSYRQQFPFLAAAEPGADYDWLTENPEHLFRDPDFLRFNPEFDVISIGSPRGGGGLVLSGRTSDAATEVWRWVLADPEAQEWLKGAADQWGMNVNPLFAASDTHNPSGTAFGEPIPDRFPRNDPYCYQAPEDHDITPRPLCMLDQAPLSQDLAAAARQTRAADDRATVSHDTHNPNQQTATLYWGTEGPQPTGARSILSLTDTASAARYGLQTASLSRAGDNGDDRAFVAPGEAGLVQGVKAMKPFPETDVLVPDPSADVEDAYPLTMLTYAAVTARSIDADARADYSKFITYAAGPGQTPGFKFGDLLRGYAPLPEELQTQATAAAKTIAESRPIEAAEEEEALEETASESERATEEPEAIDVFEEPPTLESLAMPELLTEITRPSPAPVAQVLVARPSRAFGDTPEFVAGVIRFAVPFLAVLGGIALLLFLVFDASRLKALALAAASRSDR